MWKYLSLVLVLFPSLVLSLEVNPTPKQIEQAKNEGKALAESYKKDPNGSLQHLTDFMNRYEFGAGGICGAGTVTTTIKNIVLSSYLQAKESRELNQADVDAILLEGKLAVEIASCYETASPSKNGHLLVKQKGKEIQPLNVQQFSKQAQSGLHINSVKAEFDPHVIDPQAPTTLVFLPATGEALEYKINLASMP